MSDITKKPEKIASAIYLVTGFFPDNEPLKWKLRTLMTDFVSVTMSFGEGPMSGGYDGILRARKIVLEASSLLSIAKTSGLVSDANHELLGKELSKYNQILALDHDLRSIVGLSITEPSRTLEKSKAEETPSGLLDLDRRVESGKYPIKSGAEMLARKATPLPQQETPTDKGQSLMEKKDTTSNLKNFGTVSVKKNTRQSIIIGVLKRKKEIMIKDVSPLIKGCSEKTIQRELLSMVKSGILKKEGEKRWSKYSLA